jgi:hypothetical protein
MKKPITMILFITVLMCNSCYIDKRVLLIPEEPFAFYENNVEFQGGSRQVSYIGFNSPNREILYSFIVQSNEKLEQVYLKSLVLSIKELGIEVNKENIMIPIDNKSDIRKSNINSKFEYDFYGQPHIVRFTTEEIQNAYPEKITLNELYHKFREVRILEYSATVIYEINGEHKESKLIWKQKTRRETTFITIFDIIKRLSVQ